MEVLSRLCIHNPENSLSTRMFSHADHCDPFDPLKSGFDSERHTGIQSRQATMTGPSIAISLQIRKDFEMPTQSRYGLESALPNNSCSLGR